MFDQLGQEVLSGLAREARSAGRSRVCCWHAGCASGEEPYTVSMIWQQVVASEFRDVELSILATDSDQRMLDRAAVGRYPALSPKQPEGFPQGVVGNAFWVNAAIWVNAAMRVRTALKKCGDSHPAPTAWRAI